MAAIIPFVAAAATAYSVYESYKSQKEAKAQAEAQVKQMQQIAKTQRPEERVTSAGEYAAERARRVATKRKGYMATLLTPPSLGSGYGMQNVTTGVRKSLLGG